MKKTILWIAGIVIGLIALYNIDTASEPPVSVLFRSSMVGLGKVMIITNTSDKPLYTGVQLTDVESVIKS